MGHHCCVPRCSSNSRYSGGNAGLTFHAFPIDSKERKLWIISVRRANYKKLTVNKHTKVCSKHFRDEDFVQPQNSKRRMLKKGVVPSVFSWAELNQESSDDDDDDDDKKAEPSSNNSDDNRSKVESKVQKSVAELKEADRELLGKGKVESSACKASVDTMERKVRDKVVKKETNSLRGSSGDLPSSDPSCVSPAKSDDSEQGSVSDVTTTNGSSPNSSTNGTPSKKQESALNFQIGTRLEAKDLGNEMWYPVKVVEVDWDDEEILIHFEKWSQRYDEWIPMDSSRLRATQNTTPQNDGKNASKIFSVGDRVMAKWSDSRRYPAKVKSVLGNDRYEVLFFDGFTKNMKGIRMSKLEGEADKIPEVGPGALEKLLPPVISKPVIKNEVTSEAIGTKQDRRERKRKINVVELFHPKKRLRLDPDAPSSKSSTEVEKGKKAGKGKRRKESYTKVNDGDDNEGKMEVDEAPRGRRKNVLDDTPKSANRSVHRDSDKEEIVKWESDGQNGYIVESADGPRKTTVVPDKNLPSGWSKHTIQRKHGNSAGKWDVFLVNSQGRRFRSRNELRLFFEEKGEPFKIELFDFCLSGKKRPSRTKDTPLGGRKMSRGGGGKAKAVVGPSGDGGEQQPLPLQQQPPAQRRVKTLLPKIRIRHISTSQSEDDNCEKHSEPSSPLPPYTTTVAQIPAIKVQTEVQEGEVLVGGLKIQMENNTFKCPKDGCGKNFRKENLLQMHLKHYHPEYNKFMGSTPNVADLAYARTIGESIDDLMPKSRYSGIGPIGVGGTYLEKTNRCEQTRKSKTGVPIGVGSGKGGGGGGGDCSPASEKKKATTKEKQQSTITTKKPGKGMVGDGEGRAPADDTSGEKKQLSEEKPTVVDNRENTSTSVADIATAITHREEKKEPQTTIKTLMPVIRSPTHAQEVSATERLKSKFPAVEEGEEYIEVIDVGPRQIPPTHTTSLQSTPQVSVPTSQSTTNLTKSLRTIRRRRLSDFHFEPLHKRRKIASASKLDVSEDVDVVDDGGSPADAMTPTATATAAGTVGSGKSTTTTYRYSRKKTPVVHLEKLNVITDSNAEQSSVEQLRKEELINCTCGFMEEDGLMIQCDLCLCWQHGICNNIEKETEVPEKYVCPICLNPYRQRKSKKFLHDQDWLKEGKLPSLSFRSKNETNILEREAILKRSHDLTGSLLQIQQVLHSLRVKVNIAGKSDHPKLYLWAKSWEKEGDSSSTQQTSASQPQVVAENEFKPQLENSASCRHNKTASDTSIVAEPRASQQKDTMPNTDYSENGGAENVDSNKPDMKTEDMETVIEQQVQEETVVIETETSEVVSSAKVIQDDNRLDSRISEENKTDIGSVTTKSIDSNEITCSSSVVSNEQHPLSTNNESHSTALPSNENTGTKTNEIQLQVEGTSGNVDSTRTFKDTHATDQEVHPAVEPVNPKEEAPDTIAENVEVQTEEKEGCVHEACPETKPEVTDTCNPSDDVSKQPNSSSAEETAKSSSEEKPDEITSHLESHGLLHQALTNGSQAANPLNNGGIGSQLDTTGHPMLQLPICQSELMQFASTMADNLRVTEPARPAAPVPVPVSQPPRAPQPEAPIDPVECRLCLLDHIDHFQTQIDTRLTMLEEQVAALESQDPDAAKDEAPDFYPQTKQTIEMLLRDVLTMRRISALN